MEYRVCVCAASLVGKERSKETKWSYERVEIAACVVGRARGGMFTVCCESHVCRLRK